VLVAVKDLVNVAATRSTSESPIFAELIPNRDRLLAERLRRAGAILIGKTNVSEFGLGSHTFNPVYGATRNPYDADLTCGGSSGGLGHGHGGACGWVGRDGKPTQPGRMEQCLRISAKLGSGAFRADQGHVPLPAFDLGANGAEPG